MSEEKILKNPPIKGKSESFQFWDIEENAEKMLRKSMVVWGESEAGKSYIINTILYALSPYVFKMYAFSKTAESDNSFPIEKYTSRLFIKDYLDMELIENILQKGKANLTLLRKATDISEMKLTTKEVILPLYSQFNSKEFSRTKIAYLRIRKIEKKLKNKDITRPEKEEIEKKIVSYYKILMYRCKKFLRKNKNEIIIPPESRKYMIPIMFHDLRPDTLLYFNDVSSDAKNLKKDEKTIYGDLHTQERHSGITVLWALHNTTFMAKEIRIQIKFNIFMTPAIITSFITSNNVTGTLKKQLEDARDSILVPDVVKTGTNRKYYAVLFDKIHGRIYYTCANIKLESEYVGDERLYEAIKKHERPVLENNVLDMLFQ